MGKIIIPGQTEMKMSLEVLKKIARYILDSKEMKSGDKFTITGTDKKKLIIHLE